MKRFISVLLILLLMTVAAYADSNTVIYTMNTDNLTILQNDADRNIAYNKEDLATNPLVEGESPTTGYPVFGESRYMPMLVQISNPSYGVVYEDPVTGASKKVTTAGVSQRAPWGGQYADIVYEGVLYGYGPTRISFLLNDCFADAEEDIFVGPVRSARIGHVLLREEWQCGFIFHGGPETDGNNIQKELKRLGANKKGVIFDQASTDKYNKYWHRIPGIITADNVSSNVTAMRNLIPESAVAEPHPFLFSDECAYMENYETAYSIHLDWGHEEWVSHMYYNENDNLYRRYSGPVPYLTYLDESRNEDEMEPMAFSNVIVQRVHYDYAQNNTIMPIMKSVGQGNADIFIGGHYIPGYWVRESETSPTVFFDDKGNEIVLTRGKTYIAHLPESAVLAYGQDGLN